MSAIDEIVQAIEKLPPEQWMEIRRWIDSHFPKGREESNSCYTAEPASGCDWKLPCVDAGGLKVPLSDLHAIANQADRAGAYSVENDTDGLPLIRATGGAITSALVREIEGLGA